MKRTAATWTGWVVLLVLEGDNLVSLPEVSVQITQSVIPITAVLFIICEALSLPEYWRRISAGLSHDELEAAEADPTDLVASGGEYAIGTGILTKARTTRRIAGDAVVSFDLPGNSHRNEQISAEVEDHVKGDAQPASA